ncbi:hypothetical protein LR48_Vigan04g128600 [Vigna angularis]|uniref:Uncharacterized protein n=1 Tax=Phaseolus angularis TaxID=3914 RepID=A0A0L9UEC4_PHAAN|nr:hypothetical protein LR48_Vigan04g128600 [Vigna angularis]
MIIDYSLIAFCRSGCLLTAFQRSVLTARSRSCSSLIGSILVNFLTLNIFFYSVSCTQFRLACVRHRSVFNCYPSFSLLAVFNLQLCSTLFSP